MDLRIFLIFVMAVALFVFFVLVGNYLIYQNLSNIKNTSFEFTFPSIILLVISPILILGSPLFFTYRQLVNLILSSQYEYKYGGLLEGRDSVYNLENENPVHLLFMIKYQENNSKTFYDTAKNKIYSVLKQKANCNPKIFGTIHRSMGYSYLLLNEITFDDCVKKLKTTDFPMNKEDLLQMLSEYTNVPLPKNRHGLWDVFVGTQSVKWIDDVEIDNTKYYPILFRMNHSFADGKHILGGIIELFADKEVKVACSARVAQVCEPESFTYRTILSFFIVRGLNIIFHARQLCISCLSPSVSLVNALLADNPNPLHGPRMNYKKHLFISAEKSSHYIQLVKRIKNKISSCTFEDVFLAAIAGSFRDYFKKNGSHIPIHIASEVPAVPIRFILPEKPEAGKMFCRNRLTYAIRKLPTKVDFEKPNAALNLLLNIKKEGASVRLSLEHEINYFILSVICHLVPAQILRPFFDIVHNNTVLITNVPGPSFATVLGGHPIQDIGAWAATRGYTGVGFTIFTYDNRLQLSMIVDKAVSPNRNDVQSLLDGVFKYLNLLEQQTMNITDRDN